jgi:hypothetical protein
MEKPTLMRKARVPGYLPYKELQNVIPLPNELTTLISWAKMWIFSNAFTNRFKI